MKGQRGCAAVGIVAIALLSSFLSAAPVIADATPVSGTGTVRLSGSDRYATAAAISQRVFAPPQDVMFVVSGEDFPDALAAGPAAAHFRAPILLVRRSSVPKSTLEEMQRLAPARVFVIGGPGVINGPVVETLQTAIGGATITRVSGRDRYETAEAVSHLFTGISRYVLASGQDFPDGLSGGAYAAAVGAKLILTRRDDLPAPTRRVLAAEQATVSPDVIVVGGTGVISSTVVAEIRALLPDVEMYRRGGLDRYETAAIIARDFDIHPAQSAYLASGTSFADALSGSPVAGIAERDPVQGSPIILTRPTCHPAPTWQVLQDHAYPLKVVLGGSAVAYAGIIKC